MTAGSETWVLAQGAERIGQRATPSAPPSWTYQLWPCSIAIKCSLLKSSFRCVKAAPSTAAIPGTESVQGSPGHSSSSQSKSSVSLTGVLVHLPVDSGFQELQSTNS